MPVITTSNNNDSVNGTNGAGMNTSSTPSVSNFPNVYIGQVIRVDSVNNQVGFNNAYLQNIAYSSNNTDAATVGQVQNLLDYINHLSFNLNNLAQSFYGNSNTIAVNPATGVYTIPNQTDQTITDLTISDVNSDLLSNYASTSQFVVNHPVTEPVNDQVDDILS